VNHSLPHWPTSIHPPSFTLLHSHTHNKITTMRFFSKHSSANIAATYLAPNGLSIALATKNGQPRRYGPGTILHGQVNLSLSKPILRPCQLRVVFTCTSTLDSTTNSLDHHSSKDDFPSSSLVPTTTTLFEVEHLLIDNQTLPFCGRHAPLHFCIKLPLCNYPPSMEVKQKKNRLSWDISHHILFSPLPSFCTLVTSLLWSKERGG
jgi:hypothetical protein